MTEPERYTFVLLRRPADAPQLSERELEGLVVDVMTWLTRPGSISFP